MPRRARDPADRPPDARMLDLMLDDYARELELRAASERELGPVVARLRRGLERWAADRAAVAEVRDARSAYVATLAQWQGALEEWVPIRGMSPRLEAAVEVMSNDQWSRFNALESQAAAASMAPSTLDADHEVVRRLLLRFEEFAEDPPPAPPESPASEGR
mgnify:CR=1 FL=1